MPKPQSRKLDPIASSVPPTPINQIIAVRGKNPWATGIDVAGKLISDAIQQRTALRQQAQETEVLRNQLQQMGMTTPNIPGGTPENLLKMAQIEASLKKENPQNQARTVLLSDYKKNQPLYDSLQDAGVSLRIVNDGNNPNLEARYDNMVLNWASKMVNDPGVKPLIAQNVNFSQINDILGLAKQGNTLAANTLGVKMARAMGEVGVMTDTDVVRYVQSGQLARSAADKLSRMLKGSPTDMTLDEMSQISNVMREKWMEKVQPRYNWYADVLSKNTKGNISPTQAAELLGFTYMKPQSQAVETPTQRKARLLNELKGVQ